MQVATLAGPRSAPSVPGQVAAHPLRHTPADAPATVGPGCYDNFGSLGTARPTGLRREVVVPTAGGRLPAVLGRAPNCGDASSDAAHRFGGPPPTTKCVMSRRVDRASPS